MPMRALRQIFVAYASTFGPQVHGLLQAPARLGAAFGADRAGGFEGFDQSFVFSREPE